MVDVKIPAPAGECSVCGRTFGEGEVIVSLLEPLEGEEGYRRLDVCDGCVDDAMEERCLCMWRRKAKVRRSGREQVVTSDVIFDIFMQLEGRQERYDVCFRYVLALLLLRMKRFELADVSMRDGKDVLIMRDRKVKDFIFEVEDPVMTGEEQDLLRKDLGRLLGMEGQETELREDEKSGVSEMHQS